MSEKIGASHPIDLVHDVLENSLCKPRHARVEKCHPLGAFGTFEDPGIELADNGTGLQRRAGLHVLHPAHQPTDLVLPASSGGQHLLDFEDLEEQLLAQRGPVVKAFQRRKNRSRKN